MILGAKVSLVGLIFELEDQQVGLMRVNPNPLKIHERNDALNDFKERRDETDVRATTDGQHQREDLANGR